MGFQTSALCTTINPTKLIGSLHTICAIHQEGGCSHQNQRRKCRASRKDLFLRKLEKIETTTWAMCFTPHNHRNTGIKRTYSICHTLHLIVSWVQTTGIKNIILENNLICGRKASQTVNLHTLQRPLQQLTHLHNLV